ncbi:DUF3024 domain-containing protein [Nesterenkonia salmonea]|uniref:DUF3024 domain-containing protein n=1 Tax=Nesterenkonia salmonea TaxID=1804987 RepID=A0A5R9BCZ0_9MICC|nr:DUF3024 domain-containing protein [Nesterenkonia salmonea]TLP98495.1 DUF3024 domain-containing protein [Nesterenkonia salmonea]
MAVPASDTERIAEWCDQRVPEHLKDRIRIECDVTNRHVDILECHPPYSPHLTEWSRLPIARLRYTTRTGLWSIYWRDRNLKFHAYPWFQPTANVREVLAFLESTNDPIFWG